MSPDGLYAGILLLTQKGISQRSRWDVLHKDRWECDTGAGGAEGNRLLVGFVTGYEIVHVLENK